MNWVYIILQALILIAYISAIIRNKKSTISVNSLKDNTSWIALSLSIIITVIWLLLKFPSIPTIILCALALLSLITLRRQKTLLWFHTIFFLLIIVLSNYNLIRCGKSSIAALDIAVIFIFIILFSIKAPNRLVLTFEYFILCSIIYSVTHCIH